MISSGLERGLSRVARSISASSPTLQALFGGSFQVIPSLLLTATSCPENTAPGTFVGAAYPVNANNPGPVSIVGQSLANALAMTDGESYEVGSAGGPTGTLNFEAGATFTVTFQYADDDGTYQLTRTFTLTDVADGPTITGAATDLETMTGAPVVGTDVTGDLRDLFVSPTGQALSFVVSHGAVDVDGYSWTWMPAAASPTTVEVTATDEDGQALTINVTVDVAAANAAPVAGDITLTVVVPPPAGAPGGIGGLDTLAVFIDDTGTKSLYSGTIAGVVAGEWIAVAFAGRSDSPGINVPATTGNLNAAPATLAATSGATTTVQPFAGILLVQAGESGDLPFEIQLTANARSLNAAFARLTGLSATPVVDANGTASLSTDQTTWPGPAGYTPDSAGNLILSVLSLLKVDVTGYACTGADTTLSDTTGGIVSSDNFAGYAYHVAADDTTPVTLDHTWNEPTRPAMSWVELAKG